MNVEKILEKVDSLPPMPAVAAKLLDASGSPDLDLSSLAMLLEQDPAMTVNMLRICNSSFYGLRTKVSSMRQATSLLGIKKIVQIAMSIFSSKYLSPSQSGYALEAGELWKSSVTSAIAAEIVAEEIGYGNSSAAYTAGLLQDIGKIALADYVGQSFADIQSLIENEGLGWEEAERRIIGITHPEVGGLLLERWGFPEALVESVRHHHGPRGVKADKTLSNISHLANALAMTLGIGLGADGLIYYLDDEALKDLGVKDKNRIDAMIAALGEKIKLADELLMFGHAS